MKIAMIGRSELMYETMTLIKNSGYEIPLIITSKEAPEYKFSSSDFEKYAHLIGAEFLHHPKINSTLLKSMSSFNDGIDIALSVNYSGIIPEDVINLFPLGILNAHAGDLPKYRGNAPLAWAILRNEEKIGLCIHKMIGGELDSGDIIIRKYFPITINTRIQEAFDWVNDNIPSMMLEAIKRLEKNPLFFLEKQTKDPQKALRGYPRKPEDGKIKWSASNKDILRLINASSEPFAGAYCEFDDSKMIIWRAELYSDSEHYLAIPGQISVIKKSGEVVVITSDGKILLKEVEFKGQRGKPNEFIKSIRKRLS